MLHCILHSHNNDVGKELKSFFALCVINCVIHVMQPTGLRFYSFSNFNTSMRSVELQTKMSFNIECVIYVVDLIYESCSRRRRQVNGK